MKLYEATAEQLKILLTEGPIFCEDWRHEKAGLEIPATRFYVDDEAEPSNIAGHYVVACDDCNKMMFESGYDPNNCQCSAEEAGWREVTIGEFKQWMKKA